MLKPKNRKFKLLNQINNSMKLMLAKYLKTQFKMIKIANPFNTKN